MHGQQRKVRARVRQIGGFSAHADRGGLMGWLRELREPPRRLSLTHGEEANALALPDRVRGQSKWDVTIPHHMETHQLG